MYGHSIGGFRRRSKLYLYYRNYNLHGLFYCEILQERLDESTPQEDPWWAGRELVLTLEKGWRLSLFDKTYTRALTDRLTGCVEAAQIGEKCCLRLGKCRTICRQ